MEYDNGHQYHWNQDHFQDILVTVIGKQMFSSQLSVIPKFLFLVSQPVIGMILLDK